ncbi:hypothetical protein KSP40_PGU002291 [Platanthera guangdongensis]|uniref:Uncharacterized protein n=1 Tax=Platanthera guangdongensis TaxID=2320717 RepID=A0ABR2M122_9ASPA
MLKISFLFLVAIITCHAKHSFYDCGVFEVLLRLCTSENITFDTLRPKCLNIALCTIPSSYS